MSYGIATYSLIPLRKEESETSEMVSQILFGEHYKVLEEGEKWLRIELAYDGYQGWIDSKMHMPLTREEYETLEAETPYVTTSITRLSTKEGYPFTLTPASSLYKLHNGCFSLAGKQYCGVEKTTFSGTIQEKIRMVAVSYLNAPYLWGGKSPFGIDCSGFVQCLFKICQIKLPRDASQQVDFGEDIAFSGASHLGDLAFFDNEEKQIIHVGMVWEDGQIIHASGKVRIDKLDQQGIYNEELQSYTHNLRVIKRLF